MPQRPVVPEGISVRELVRARPHPAPARGSAPSRPPTGTRSSGRSDRLELERARGPPRARALRRRAAAGRARPGAGPGAPGAAARRAHQRAGHRPPAERARPGQTDAAAGRADRRRGHARPHPRRPVRPPGGAAAPGPGRRRRAARRGAAAGPARRGLRRPGRGAAARRPAPPCCRCGPRGERRSSRPPSTRRSWSRRPRAHPVVWTGRYLDAVAPGSPAAPPARAVAAGGAAWLVGAVAAVAAGPARRARSPGEPADRPVRSLRGLALWPLLSARMLLAEVARGGGAPFDETSADGPRRAVPHRQPRHRRAAPRRRSGARRSSRWPRTSPTPWWRRCSGTPSPGSPAPPLYRYANTADACWGYRTPRWRYAGRVAARADDALNLRPRPAHRRCCCPARSSCPGCGRRPAVPRRPNAGWPMAAMALRLDLRLAKRGHYELQPDRRRPRRR